MTAVPWSRGQEEVMHSIAHSLNRIANCLEADEKRKRAQDLEQGNTLEGHCQFVDCEEPVVMMLNGERYCRTHVDEGFRLTRPAMQAVMRGMQDLEKEVRETDG